MICYGEIVLVLKLVYVCVCVMAHTPELFKLAALKQTPSNLKIVFLEVNCIKPLLNFYFLDAFQ